MDGDRFGLHLDIVTGRVTRDVEEPAECAEPMMGDLRRVGQPQVAVALERELSLLLGQVEALVGPGAKCEVKRRERRIPGGPERGPADRAYQFRASSTSGCLARVDRVM